MILALHASDRGSHPSFAILFYSLLLLFSVCFCCFYFDLFSVLALTASIIRQFLHLGIKAQKAVDILYCVQKFSLFLCSHSTCLHIRAIFDHTNEVFMQQNMFTGYIIHFSKFSFHNALNCLIYRTQKRTAEMSIAIKACTICMLGNYTV